MKGFVVFWAAAGAVLLAVALGAWTARGWWDQGAIDQARAERAQMLDLTNANMILGIEAVEDLHKCLAVLHAPQAERKGGR